MNELVQNTLVIGMPFMMTPKTGPKQYVPILPLQGKKCCEPFSARNFIC